MYGNLARRCRNNQLTR
jgi:Ca2+-binding EF-hand superfamily protein